MKRGASAQGDGMYAGGAAPATDGVYGGFDVAAAEGGGGEPEPLFSTGGGGAGDDGDDKKPRHKRAGAGFGLSGGKLVLAPAFACLGLVTLFLLLMSAPSGRAPVFVFACCAYGALFSYWLYASVLAHDDGTAAMREVADPIREGAEGFLRVQYRAIARNAAGVFALILVSYHLRPSAPPAARGGAHGVQALGNGALGAVTALAFVAGAACSAGAGYLSMWVASLTNIRVAGAARRSYAESLVVCFRGGAFSAVLSISLCVFGVAALYYVLGGLFGGDADELGERASGRVAPTSVPMLMVRRARDARVSRDSGGNEALRPSRVVRGRARALARSLARSLSSSPWRRSVTASARASSRSSCSSAAASTRRRPTSAPTSSARSSRASPRTTRATRP